MRNFGKALAFILVILLAPTALFAQQILPYNGTFVSTDSVQLTWGPGSATSYTLTINDGVSSRDVVLSTTSYWLKGYQPFDTISLTLSGFNLGGLVYKSSSVLYTANFASHSKLCLWLDPASADTIAGGVVTQWRDKSKRDFIFTQPTAANRPLLKNYSGIRSLNFTTDFLSSGFYDIDSIVSTFVMLRHDGITSGINMFLSKTSDRSGSYTLSKFNGIARSFILGSSYTSTIPIDNNWLILSYIYRPSKTFTIERNFLQSQIHAITNAYTGTNTFPLTIGRNATGSSNYGGDISEIVIFSESLSFEKNYFVKKYLSAKYSPPPTPQSIVIEDRFCEKNLSLPNPYVSYLWNTGSTNPSITVNFSGNYTVKVQNNFEETFNDTIRVRYPEIALRDTFFCSFDSVQLTSGLDPAKFDFSWSNGQVTPTVWIKNSGFYSVLVKDKFGCSRLSSTINVKENNFPRSDLFPKDTVLCVNNQLLPSIPNLPTNKYLWNNGKTDSSVTINTAGKYMLTVTEHSGCNAIDSVSVSIRGNAPIVRFESDTICLGTATSFTEKTVSADPIASYNWDFSEGTGSVLQHPQHIYISPGTKSVRLEVLTTTGCLGFSEKEAIVGEIPVSSFTVINGDFGCTAQNMSIVNTSHTSNDGIVAQNWDFGNGASSIETVPVYKYPSIGNYMLKLTNTTEYNCTSNYSVPVTIYTPTGSPCIPQLVFPLNDTALLKPTQRLRWSNTCNSFQQKLQVSVASDFASLILDSVLSANALECNVTLPYGTYWWRIYNVNNCKDTVVSTSGRFTIFKPEMITDMRLWLDAGRGVETDLYGNVAVWRDLAPAGKHAKQDVLIQRPAYVAKALNDLPVVRFDGINDLLVGQNLYADEHNVSIFIVHKYDGARESNVQTLLAQVGDKGIKYRIYTNAKSNFKTSFGILTNAPIGNAESGKVYYALSSTVSSAQTEIFSNGIPNGSATFANYVGMETEFVIGSYASNSLTQVFSGDIAEILIFNRALSADERKKIDAYLLSKYQPEPIELGPDRNIPYKLCPEEISLAAGYTNYAWSTGEQSSKISTIDPGRYSATVTSAFGLTSHDSILINRPKFHCGDTSICYGGQLKITPGPIGAYRYQWSNGDTSPEFLSAVTGTFSLTVTDTSGCKRTFEDFNITVDSFPLQATLGVPKRTLCHGQTFGLEVGASKDTKYLWSDGSTLPTYAVSKSEKVTVTVTDKWSCKAFDTVQVKLQGFPVLTNFSVSNTCFKDVTNFTSLSAPYDSIAKIQWSIDGALVSQAPNFSMIIEQQGKRVVNLTTTSVSGCISTKIDTVFIKPKPVADFVISESCTSAAYRYVNSSYAGKQSTLVSANWILGSEKTSVDDIVYHQFASTGTKNISLSVVNSFGCTDNLIKQQAVVGSYYSPGVFSLISPANNSIVMDSIVTFRWEQSTNGYRYILQLSRTPDFASIEYTDSSYTTYLNAPVRLAGDYYWRVQVYNICGSAVYSGTNRLERINLNTQSTVALWLKADAGITFAGDSAVAVWADQSAKKINVTQTTTACQPVFRPDAINGKPAIVFDGTTDQLKTAVTLGVSTSNMSIFVISKFNENKIANLNTILSHRTSTGVKFSMYAPSNTDNTLTYGSYPPETEPLGASSYGVGDFKISSLVAKADSTFIYTNSKLTAKGKTVLPTGTDNVFIVGGMVNATSSTYNLSGEIAEIIIFNTALSANEQVQIENYLFNKYSTPLELGNDISYSLCQKELVAPDVYKTYLWNTHDTGNMTKLTGPGTYRLTVTDQLGKTWVDSVIVSRPFVHNLHDSIFCAKDTIHWNLNMPGDYQFHWSDGSTLPNNAIYQNATLSARITDTLGCTDFSDTVSFSVDDFPLVSSIGGDRSVCRGEYIFFENANESASKYQWASGSSLIYDIVNQSGLYSVTATNNLGCVFADTVTINVVGQAPGLTVAVPDICQNNPQVYSAQITTLAGDPIKTVTWKFGSSDVILGNTATYTFANPGASSVAVNAETENGCKASFYVPVSVKPNPSSAILATFGKTHCVGSPITFRALASSPASISGYSWDFGKSGISANKTYSVPGKYPVSLVTTNNNGCKWTTSDTVTVKSNIPPTQWVNLLAPANKDVILDTIPLFAWSVAENVKFYVLKITGANGTVITADSLTATSLGVKITANQKYTWQVLSVGYCGDTLKSAVFTFEKTDIRILNPTLWFDASDLALQPGQFVTKWGKSSTIPVAQSNIQYSPILSLASNAANSRNIVSFDGTRSLVGQTDLGLDKFVTLTALVRIDSTAKLGMIISKGYSGDGSYSLAVAANTNKLTLYIDGTSISTARSFYGWVMLTVQHKQDSILMYVDNKLELAYRSLKDNKGANAFPLNIGKSSQSATYYFSGAVAEMLAFSTFLTPYQRSVVDKYLYSKYSPSLILPADSVTSGFYPLTIKSPSGFRTYNWSTEATTRDITIKSSNNYKLTVLDMAGNQLVDSCRITYPFVNQINDTAICLGSSIVWDPKLTGEYLYDWNKNDNPLEGVTNKLTISTAGTYQLFVTDKYGYTWSSRKVKVSVIDLTGSLDLGSDKTVCKFELLEPMRKPDNLASFMWDNGSVLPYTYALDTRTYRLSVTDTYGCTVEDSISVIVKGEAPTAVLGLSDLCENAESRFAPTIKGSVTVAKYLWKIGEETYSADTVKDFFLPTAQLPVRLSLETATNCRTVVFDTIAVLPVINKSIIIFPSTENCIGNSFTATTQPQSIEAYHWSDNKGINESTSAYFKPSFSQAGLYTLQLRAQLENGCVVAAKLPVTVNAEMPSAEKPQIQYPANDMRIFDKNVIFRWSEQYAEFYTLQVAYDINFAQLAVTRDSIQAQQCEVAIAKDSTYFWRVIAHNYCGGTIASAISRFERFSVEAFNPVVWINASNVSVPDRTRIGTWGEPATHTFVQPDVTRQPIYCQKSTAIGNMPSVEFVNKAYMSGDTLLPLDSMQTVIGLVENSMLGSYGMVISKQFTGEGSFTLSKNTGNTQFRMYIDGANLLNKKFCPGWSLVCFTTGKDTVFSYFDNAVDSKHLLSKDFKGRNKSPITIGKNSAADDNHFIGKIAELMVLPKALSVAEYQLLATYFTNKYQPVISLPDTVRLAGFRSEQLSVATGFRSYEWSTGATDSSITVTDEGTYSITATDYFGRQLTASTVVIAPKVHDLIDSVLCVGESTVWESKLSAPFSFVWYRNGEQLTTYAPSLSISSEGRYQLQVIDEYGYSYWSRIRNVSVRNIATQLNLGNDSILCQNVNFYPQSLPDRIATYAWSNGATSAYVKIIDPGKYILSVTDIFGCYASDSITFVVEGLAADISIVPEAVCQAYETDLNSFVPGFAQSGISNYQWQVGDSLLSVNLHVFAAQDAAVYPIKLVTFSESGCNNAATADLVVMRIPDFDVSIFPSSVNCISQKYMLQHVYNDTIGILSYSWENSQNTFTSSLPVYRPQFNLEGQVNARISTNYTNGCSRTKQLPLTVVANSGVIETIPEIVAPANDAAIYADSIPVRWLDNGASFYSVILAKDKQLNTIVSRVDSLQSTEYLFRIDMDGDMYVAVQAHFLCGNILQSIPVRVTKYNLLSDNTMLWLNAGDLHLFEGAPVLSWGAGSNKLYQADPDYAPRLVKSNFAVAGQPVVHISDKRYMEGLPKLPLDSIRTIFMLAELPSAGSIQMILSKGLTGEGSFSIAKNNADTKLRIYADGANKTSKYGLSGWNLLCMQINGAKAKLYVNGILDSEIDFAKDMSGLNSLPITIGKTAGAATNYFTGDLAELLLLNNSIADSERDVITNYFAEKYTVPLQLPDSLVVHYGLCPAELSPLNGYKRYRWSNGDTTASIVPRNSGYYTLTATDFMGRSYIDSTYVMLTPSPILKDTAFCFQSAVALNADMGSDYAYQWSTGRQDPSIKVSATGNYAVTITDTLGCAKIIGPIAVDIDFFAQEASLGPDLTLCEGNRIGLVHRSAGVTEFLWSDGTTGSTLPILQSGTVSLWSKNTRGCEMRDTIQVNVSGKAPTADFAVDGHCQGEPVYFTSHAVSSDSPISSYQWEIAGKTFSGTLLEQKFTKPGTFTAKHIARKSDGCTDSAIVKFNIYPTPSADFLPLQGCENQSIRFRPVDVQNSDVIAHYFWVNGEDTSEVVQPVYQFDTTGQFPITLISVSDSGCSDTTHHDIIIKQGVSPRFVHSPACQGIATAFFNKTELEPVQQVIDEIWTVDGEAFQTSANFEYLFKQPGTFNIGLTMKTVNGCSNTYNEDVVVTEMPKVFINVNNGCTKDSVSLNCDSISPKNVGYSAFWSVNGAQIGGSKAKFVSDTPGIYHAEISVTTQYGCSVTDTAHVKIYARPEATFEYGDTAQIMPFNFELRNLSRNTDSSVWIFDMTDTVHTTVAHLRIKDTSALNVQLLTINTDGCRDSISKRIGFISGFRKLVATNVFAYNQDGYSKTLFAVKNSGTASIGIVNFYIEIDNTYFIKEQWTGTLSGGDTLQYVFRGLIKELTASPRKICVYASLVEQAGNESFTDTLCTSLDQAFGVLPLYPNPSRDNLMVDYSVPADGSVIFGIESATGVSVATWNRTVAQGYNVERIEISALSAGTYTLRIKYGNETRHEQFVKLK